MKLLWKIVKAVGVVAGLLATYGFLITDAIGVEMWGLAWQYWAMIGFTVFWVSLAVVIYQLHSENRTLKMEQIKGIKHDLRFLDHCNGLAKAAFELAGKVWTLLDLKGKSGITVDGNLISGVEVTRAGALGIDKIKIDYTYNMQYLEQHLKMDTECLLENLRLTTETVTPELHKRLNTLVDSCAFKLAPKCPICKALLGESATDK